MGLRRVVLPSIPNVIPEHDMAKHGVLWGAIPIKDAQAAEGDAPLPRPEVAGA